MTLPYDIAPNGELSVEAVRGTFEYLDRRVRVQGTNTFCGTGDPNGVVTGNVGDEFTDRTGAAGAIKFVKTTAGGDTGWVAFA